jgi:hypothetical protein
MTDEKILEVYEQVRNRYSFFDYWKKTIDTDQIVNSDNPYTTISNQFAKTDKALDRDVIIAFAKEIALWWENES